ncbi:uncharacterized protein [Epargyreus clarus]|uniref:uncharacterized protein n=1 Tax=Epargyreus clarus TaxID=520877 RepID=UPI003C2C03A7
MSSNMNIDALIALVRKKPQLWDRGNKFHSNRNVLDKCWREIAGELNEEEHKVRKKWKYLRDQFSVEYGKIPPAGCEEEMLTYEPKWRYYKSLQFLEEVVTPRVNTKNPRRDEDSSEGSQDTSAPGSPSPMENELKTRYKERMMEMKKQKLRYMREKQKMKRSSEMVNEEHMHFFKSLLPHVRSIPPHMQLSFRNRVQAVVEEFAYRPDPTAVAGSEKPFNETYFITCVPDHETKCEPPESVDESQDQDDMKDDDGSS